ncbi:10455_t:CDS:2 [Paraglomus occultum]|uniref:10455_t:CDS:1 n=1 Tax=Paraglomus occultum TaxID=144539 RepID=A0A9N8WIH8_9GLOM|nr:10455_t:CDS:2 [Paraglomus occultum]
MSTFDEELLDFNIDEELKALGNDGEQASPKELNLEEEICNFDLLDDIDELDTTIGSSSIDSEILMELGIEDFMSSITDAEQKDNNITSEKGEDIKDNEKTSSQTKQIAPTDAVVNVSSSSIDASDAQTKPSQSITPKVKPSLQKLSEGSPKIITTKSTTVEKEEGEISGVGAKQHNAQSTQKTMNSQQLGRGRGTRRADWRPIYRPGFGPGVEALTGMPMNHHLPMAEMPIMGMHPEFPQMLSHNIHVNPSFAGRVRPFGMIFPPFGAAAPMMNYQGPMTPQFIGRTNGFPRNNGLNSFGQHHLHMQHNQHVGQHGQHNQLVPQNDWRLTQISQMASKRKTPTDGFEQKEQDANKRTVAKSMNKNTSASANLSPKSANNVSSNINATASAKTVTNAAAKTVANASAKTVANAAAKTVANASAKTVANAAAKTVTNTAAKTVANASAKTVANAAAKSAASAITRPSRAHNEAGRGNNANAGIKTEIKPLPGTHVVISNITGDVTQREIQRMASEAPNGYLTVQIDRVGEKASIVFKSPEGAKIFRRKFNKSVLGGVNVDIKITSNKDD